MEGEKKDEMENISVVLQAVNLTWFVTQNHLGSCHLLSRVNFNQSDQ